MHQSISRLTQPAAYRVPKRGVDESDVAAVAEPVPPLPPAPEHRPAVGVGRVHRQRYVEGLPLLNAARGHRGDDALSVLELGLERVPAGETKGAADREVRLVVALGRACESGLGRLGRLGRRGLLLLLPGLPVRLVLVNRVQRRGHGTRVGNLRPRRGERRRELRRDWRDWRDGEVTGERGWSVCRLLWTAGFHGSRGRQRSGR